MPRGSAPGERRGGRLSGTPNKRTREMREAMDTAAKEIERATKGAFAGDAHALLVTIYKDPQHPTPLRLEAAKAAAPYERPRLSAIEANVTANIKRDVDDYTDDDLATIAFSGAPIKARV